MSSHIEFTDVDDERCYITFESTHGNLYVRVSADPGAPGQSVTLSADDAVALRQFLLGWGQP